MVQPHSRKWQPLSSVTRTLSYIREKLLTDLWHFTIMVSDEKRLKAGLHTLVPNTGSFIMTRYPPVILW